MQYSTYNDVEEGVILHSILQGLKKKNVFEDKYWRKIDRIPIIHMFIIRIE